MLIVSSMIALSTLIACIEVPPLLKRGLKKEVMVFLVFLFICILLSIAQGLHAKLPNPLQWLTIVYRPLSEAVFHLLN